MRVEVWLREARYESRGCDVHTCVVVVHEQGLQHLIHHVSKCEQNYLTPVYDQA